MTEAHNGKPPNQIFKLPVRGSRSIFFAAEVLSSNRIKDTVQGLKYSIVKEFKFNSFRLIKGIGNMSVNTGSSI